MWRRGLSPCDSAWHWNDGKPLVIMPPQYFNKFSDQDLGDIVAYLKSLPPVDNDQANTKLKIL